MDFMTRVLIVDDDEDAARFLEYRLRQVCTDWQIVVRNVPDVSGEFDIYVLDNDFRGQRIAARLVQEIRRRHEDSLVVAFSGVLDTETLKQLVNAGCDHVCEKHRQNEIKQLLEMMVAFVGTQAEKQNTVSKERGLVKTIQSITSLLREWNRRLDMQSTGLEDTGRKGKLSHAQTLSTSKEMA